ncbi:MAG: maleylacetoacetate isomerase [Deltaproteobacteria bacterium]|nr:MAG: maleylacetoacetate isomerase [Deltaproteobacteria bacterium]
MKLYGYWRSSCTYRVRIALYHKGIPFETVPVHLVEGGGAQHQAPYRSLNPMRQVPYLELPDGRGIAQSMAILEYLEETHPTPPLLPEHPLERARVRQLAEMVNAGVQPLQNLSVLQALKGLGVDAKAWAASWIARGLAALEAEAKRSAGTYLVGEQLTLADLFLVPQLYNARRFEVDLAPYPTLTRVEAQCLALEAFQRALPERQPDAPPDAKA